MPRSRSRSRSPPFRRSSDRRWRDDGPRRGEEGRSKKSSGYERRRRRDSDDDSEERPQRRRDEDRGSDRNRRDDRDKRDGRDAARREGYDKGSWTDRETRDRPHSSSTKPDERLARREKSPQTRDSAEPLKDKEQANFSNTGLLAAASNTVNGVVLKYSEPSESRKPPANQRWRLFVFKDAEIVDTIELNANSCWLIGRDRAVADIPVDHPSCSKQHAVIQFRFLTKTGEFGDKVSAVRPYILDLESANGTAVNKQSVPESRYVELMDKDMITFGMSTRFVLCSVALRRDRLTHTSQGIHPHAGAGIENRGDHVCGGHCLWGRGNVVPLIGKLNARAH